MNQRKPFSLAALLFAVLVVSSSRPASAATPTFTITATSATVSSSSSSGTGSSTFTLTSVNGYAGSVRVTCAPPSPPAGVTVPYCTGGFAAAAALVPAQPPIALIANQVVTGTVTFYNAPVPCSNPCPASLPRSGSHKLPITLALAGALLFGFGFLRKPPRWLTLSVFALGSLVALVGMSACGGNKSVVSPGTYAYSISAIDVTTDVTVTTSVNVTVP